VAKAMIAAFTRPPVLVKPPKRRKTISAVSIAPRTEAPVPDLWVSSRPPRDLNRDGYHVTVFATVSFCTILRSSSSDW